MGVHGGAVAGTLPGGGALRAGLRGASGYPVLLETVDAAYPVGLGYSKYLVRIKSHQTTRSADMTKATSRAPTRHVKHCGFSGGGRLFIRGIGRITKKHT